MQADQIGLGVEIGAGSLGAGEILALMHDVVLEALVCLPAV